MQSVEQTHCRVAPSLGDFEGTHQNVWGTLPYDEDDMMHDIYQPTVFFGLYGLNDFHAMWRHRGKKWILWAGSDIRHFVKGYWLDQQGQICMETRALSEYINTHAESWVENEVEAEALRLVGVEAQVCPSFMGNVEDYNIEYEYAEIPKVYASVSGDDFDLYRWDGIEKLAKEHPSIEFHLYGNTKRWESRQSNIIVHGRVPKEQMNAEIKKMQGGLRLLKFDGFSEILAKSVLWGQWPVSAIPYSHMLPVEELHRLHVKHHPNTVGREYYLQTVNKFPWVCK